MITRYHQPGQPRTSILRIVLAILLGFPASSIAAYQGFLFIFSPPPKQHQSDPKSAHETIHEPAIDDACRICDPLDVELIELRVQTDDEDFIGHAYLRVGRFAIGFRTNERDIGLVDYLSPFSRTYPGFIRNDDDSDYDFVRSYRACPATLSALRNSIARHAVASYQVGNWNGGRNCATWCADRLADAGLKPPAGDCPNRMAWRMTSFDPELEKTASASGTQYEGGKS